MLERKEKSTKGIEKKPSGHFNTKVFFCSKKFEKHETGDAKGDKKKNRKRRHETIWTKKNMCSKNKKKGKRETQREQSEKRGDEQVNKCKEEDKNQRR